jgi:serine/threonine protein kinase
LGAVRLTLEQLRAATDGFASSELVGSGGFGQVFAGTLLPSLQGGAVPLELHHLPVAVKKARSGHSPSELQALHREVTILRECSHPHLLPLLACAAGTRTPGLPLHSCLHTQRSRCADATSGLLLAV